METGSLSFIFTLTCFLISSISTVLMSWLMKMKCNVAKLSLINWIKGWHGCSFSLMQINYWVNQQGDLGETLTAACQQQASFKRHLSRVLFTRSVTGNEPQNRNVKGVKEKSHLQNVWGKSNVIASIWTVKMRWEWEFKQTFQQTLKQRKQSRCWIKCKEVKEVCDTERWCLALRSKKNPKNQSGT